MCYDTPGRCKHAVINGVSVQSCGESTRSCTTPSKSCVSYGTKDEDVYETRYNKHPYISFTYKAWEEIDSLITK